MPVKGVVKINGTNYPVENFTITWTNDLPLYRLVGDPFMHYINPYAETEEQRDKRLNPRKYDTCHFCDHYRFRHELGYQKCTGTYVDYDYDYKTEEKCECQQFV